MILEVAKLDVKKGFERQFESAFLEASRIISQMPGYRGHELQRCVEENSRYVLLVRWNTLEDHTIGFRQSLNIKHGSPSSIISMTHFPRSSITNLFLCRADDPHIHEC